MVACYWWIIYPPDQQWKPVKGQYSLVRLGEYDQLRAVDGQSWLVRLGKSDQLREVDGQVSLVGLATGESDQWMAVYGKNLQKTNLI